jgi:hypothetical protein
MPARGDRRDLHRRHAALGGGGRERRRHDRGMAGGEAASDVLGAAIGHGESYLEKTNEP